MSAVKRWISDVFTPRNRQHAFNQEPSPSLKIRSPKENVQQQNRPSNHLDREEQQKLRKRASSRHPFFRTYTKGLYENGNDEERLNKACRKKELHCKCSNCTTLPSITECGVCLGPLQCHEIQACSRCSNLTCEECSSKLDSCPFCRSQFALERNRALERLVNSLTLPCKNSRNGCQVLVNADRRLIHESMCIYNLTCCPVSPQTCHWFGSLSTLLKHLKTAHNVIPLVQSGVSLTVSKFRSKVTSRNGVFIVYLNCYSQLFKFEIVIYDGKLFLIFAHLGYISRVVEKQSIDTYGFWVKVYGGNKKFQGIVPFEKGHPEKRKIEINCQSLLINNLQDIVKIQVGIQKMNS